MEGPVTIRLHEKDEMGVYKLIRTNSLQGAAPWTSCALTHHATGAWSEAEEAYTQALLDNPHFLVALVGYAELLYQYRPAALLVGHTLMERACETSSERHNEEADVFCEEETKNLPSGAEKRELVLFLKGVWLMEVLRRDEQAAQTFQPLRYPGALYRLGLLHEQGRGGLEQDAESTSRCYRQAATSGWINAMYKMGILHLSGMGVEMDPAVAVAWLQKAVAVGHVEAALQLSQCYEAGIGGIRSHTRAREALQRAAEGGVGDAQVSLGLELLSEYEKQGNTTQRTQGLQWLQRAAEKGNPTAQLRLGSALEDGTWGLAPHPQNARQWLLRSANQGVSEAIYRLGMAWINGKSEEDDDHGLEWLQRAGEGEDVFVGACLGLASLYVSGERGAPRDLAAAVRLYRRAAEAGCVEGMYQLARSLQCGEGVERDVKEATEWFQDAGMLGHGESCYQVGEWKQMVGDVEDAIRWFRRGVDEKHIPSHVSLAALTYEEDTPRAIQLLHTAAETGHVGAIVRLARCLDEAPSRDAVEAARWLRRAAEEGDVRSQRRLALLLEKGKGVEQNVSEARRWYERVAIVGDKEDILRVANILVLEAASLPPGTPERTACTADAATWIETGIQCYGDDTALAEAICHIGASRLDEAALFPPGSPERTACATDANALLVSSIRRGGRVRGVTEVALRYARRLLEQTQSLHPGSSERDACVREADGWLAMAMEYGIDDESLVGRVAEATHGFGVSRLEEAKSLPPDSPGRSTCTASAESWLSLAVQQGGSARRMAEMALLHAMYLLEGAQSSTEQMASTESWLSLAALYGKDEGTVRTRVAEAQFRLGMMLLHEAESLALDAPERVLRASDALKRLKTAAAEGNDEAAFVFAVCMEEGHCGIDIDLPQAAEMYATLAGPGKTPHPAASFRLARLLLEAAPYVPRDEEKAETLLLRGASAGDVRSLYHLGLRYLVDVDARPSDPLRSITCFEECVNRGLLGAAPPDDPAMHHFAEGFGQNHEAVRKDAINAAFRAGVALSRGINIPKDIKRGTTFLQVASDNGCTEAACELAQCLLKGVGVSKDAGRAVELFRKLAEQGSASAAYRLGMCLKEGTACAEDTFGSVTWLKEAADRGSVEAHFALGVMYKKGDGVARDATLALQHFKAASDAGHPMAQKFLRLVEP